MLTKLDTLGADPLLGWTDDSIKAYIATKPLAAGDHMIVANWQAGFIAYELATVQKVDHGRQGA